MAEAQVTTLKPANAKLAPKAVSTRKKSPVRKNSRTTTTTLRRQMGVAAGLGLVTIAIISLSVSHSVHGVSQITGCAQWEAWAMAVAIEIGFCLTKLGTLVASDEVRRHIGRLANVTIVGTLAGMAAMNVYAFTENATGPVMQAGGAVLGLLIPALIPALIFAFMRILAALWFDYQKRVI
jgi:hypothetical protein